MDMNETLTIEDIEREADPDMAAMRAMEFTFRGKTLSPVTKLTSNAARLMRAFPFGFEMEFAGGEQVIATGNDFLDRSAIKLMWLLSGDATRARRAALNPEKAYGEAFDWWIESECGPTEYDEAFALIMQIKSDIDGVEATIDSHGGSANSDTLGE